MTRKRSKSYTPRPLYRDEALFLLNGNDPLAPERQRALLTAVHGAAASIAQGKNDHDQWGVLSEAFNIGQIVSEESGNSDIGLDVIFAAQNALISCGERCNSIGRLGFTGDELKAVNEGIRLFEQLIAMMTRRQYAHAVAECNKRKRHGNVTKVKRGTVAKRFELRGSHA